MVLDKIRREYIGAVMVIGAGVAGIQASLDLGDLGFKVYLVEKNPSIGGRMAQLDKTFPTNDCSLCILAPKMIEINRHENIELLTYHEVLDVKGEPGNFTVKLLKKARYIDENKCNGCGMCAEICPIYAPNEFDIGLAPRKAVYIPFPQAVPLVYTIDKKRCIDCGLCERACDANAIYYTQKDETVEIEVGAIILSTGFDVYDINKIPRYGYDYINVISALEYERLLSASGPTGGQILRFSDLKKPDKIAFISCVGSRSVNSGVPYCSNVCCMYLAKECIITKEHSPDIDLYILKSDIRVFGKGFNEFIDRAKSEYKVNYINGRIGSIDEDPITKDLFIRYENTKSKQNEELRVQLVVLAVALVPSSGTKKLAEILKLDLDNHNFYKMDDKLGNLIFSQNGVFACGFGKSPKDIPESILEGSSVAAKAAEFLASVRGTIANKKHKIIKEKEVLPNDPPKIGVIVCKCGTNIGGIVDVEKVVDHIKKIPNVVIATSEMYSCSDSTRNKIKEMIEKYDLNRFIIASCSPRTHDALFRQTCQEGGLNEYLFELVNIRDQCSWVHMHEPELATEKSKKLIEMTIAKSKLLRPIKTIRTKIKSGCIIIGGGIAGMTAALSIAEQGFKCFLIEKSNTLGGILNDINTIYPSFRNPDSFLNKLKDKVKSHSNIKIFLNSIITDLKGSIGNFDAKIKSLTDSKITNLECATIIIATGADEFKPDGYYDYGIDNRIITQLELEKMLKNSNTMENGKNFFENIKNIAMIQCVGSREKNKRNYCSRICCLIAIKNALLIKERYPSHNIFILHRDIVLPGKDTEMLYRKARENGITFIRYDEYNPPTVKRKDNKLLLQVEGDIKLQFEIDLLVLSTPLIPREDNEKISKILKVPVSQELGGFFLEAHIKLRPLDFATDGIYLCGSARFPSDITSTINQALGAASRAGIVLAKDNLIVEGIISEVDPNKCIGCGICKDICPYNAIEIIITKKVINNIKILTHQAHIINQLCKGCGKCVVSCPVQAITAKHFTNSQILEMIKTCVSK